IDNFFVAIIDNKIIGCVALDIYSKKLAEIRSLAVLEEYENMGVASKLICKCIDVAKKNGVYEVLVITDELNLFKRLGFKEELENQKALFLRLRKWKS
ncbi:MAG: GNAT family N-acetyltransferase, partial [bacterium]|nr:GNAT family N-acetyltransferase [bacterium]